MSIVKEEHKATLRKWREELQAKRGNRASLRRSKSGVLPHWRWSPQLAPM